MHGCWLRSTSIRQLCVPASCAHDGQCQPGFTGRDYGPQTIQLQQPNGGR